MATIKAGRFLAKQRGFSRTISAASPIASLFQALLRGVTNRALIRAMPRLFIDMCARILPIRAKRLARQKRQM